MAATMAKLNNASFPAGFRAALILLVRIIPD